MFTIYYLQFVHIRLAYNVPYVQIQNNEQIMVTLYIKVAFVNIS